MESNENRRIESEKGIDAVERMILSGSPANPPRGSAVLLFIYFASGTCSLIDETIWVRLLKLVLGNTVYASSIVVSVFLGGLAIGGFIMARFAGKITRPLRLYALLELAIAVSALAVPLLLMWADDVYRFLYRSGPKSGAIVVVFQVVTSSLILLVPTVLMGSTLPLLGEYVTARSGRLGSRVGRLYAFNTLGAAVGCFTAGFVLMRWVGPIGALILAGALNVCVAAAAWILSRASERERTPTVAEPESIRHARSRSRVLPVLVAAFFVSGFLSIAFEILWMRSIVFLLEGNTYLFAAVLTVYLLGTVIGAGVGSRLAARAACPARAFAYTFLAFAILGLCYVPLLHVFSRYVFPPLVHLRASMPTTPLFAAAALPLMTCACLFLIPSALLGIGFPLALQAASESVRAAGMAPRPGKSTGVMYGVNTVGCVVGGVLCGFVFIPVLGVETSAVILGLVGIGTACGVAIISSPRRARTAAFSGGVLAAAVAVMFVMPQGLFRVLVATHWPHQDSELLYVHEGMTTTVSIHRRPAGNLWIVSSGAQVSGDESLGAHKMETHVGMLLNPRAEHVLDIGFGMGETAACFIRHDVNQIDSVEISPEVLQASLEYFKHVNGGPEILNHLNMTYMDGKNYLSLTGQTYDIVQSSPIHPKIFDSASLYTKEYFQSALDRLAPDGVFVCWTPMHVAESCVKSIIGTFLDVFPHATFWFQTTRPESSFVLIGSRHRQRLSFVQTNAEMNKPPVAESLAYLHIRDLMDLAMCYFGDEEAMRRYVDDYETNSDYQPFVEFNTEAPANWKEVLNSISTSVRKATFPEMIDWAGIPDAQRDRWLRDFRRTYSACSYLISSYIQNDPGPALIRAKLGLDILPGHRPLERQFTLAENGILDAATELVRQGRIDAVDKHTAVLLKAVPNSSALWLARARIQYAQGKTEDAAAAAEKALELAQQSSNTAVLDAARAFIGLDGPPN